MTARLNISIRSLFRLAAVLVLLAVPGLAGDAARKPFSRAEAAAIIANVEYTSGFSKASRGALLYV